MTKRAETNRYLAGIDAGSVSLNAFQTYFPSLTVPSYNTSTGALGVALKALDLEREDRVDLEALQTVHLDRELLATELSEQVCEKLRVKKADVKKALY
jgi:hypothetical protein